MTQGLHFYYVITSSYVIQGKKEWLISCKSVLSLFVVVHDYKYVESHCFFRIFA
jgi:hypothetical protein